MIETFGEVTKRYRSEQNLTQEAFLAALVEKFRSDNFPRTRQGLSSWEIDRTSPSLEDLFWILLIYSDWRMEWAIDAICAKMPEAFYRDKYGLAVKNGREKVIA